MARRRDPSIHDIVRINSDQLTFEYIPNYMDKWDAVAYVKGHNGHYYIMKGWYRSYIIRLYTKNQLRASDNLSWDIDHDEILDDSGELTSLAKARFLEVVTRHRPFHYVPKIVDHQRKACYRWEAAFGLELLQQDKGHLGFSNQTDALDYIKIICNREGVRAPMVRFAAKGSCSWARRDELVKLVMSGNKVSNKTIIHELAHIIDFARGRKNSAEAGHGPKFIGIYIDLLVKYGQLDRAFLERTARQHGLKIDYSTCTTVANAA